MSEGCRLPRAIGLGVAFCLGVESNAWACGSCRGPSGAGSALTAPWQRYGVSIAQGARFAYAMFDTQSKLRLLGSQSHDRVHEISISAAYRPVAAVELGGGLAYGMVDTGTPGFHSSNASTGAFGDTALRARWEVLTESPRTYPGALPRPDLGATLTMRIPTGNLDRVGQASAGAGPSPGTVGSTATSQGLGTSEFAFTVDVRKGISRSVQVGLIGEAAWRVPDTSLGVERELAPRVLGRGVALWFHKVLALGAFVDVAGEGSVRYGGRLSRDSGQRSVAVGLSGSYKSPGGLRSGLSTSWNPPVDGWSKNAVAATGISWFLSFTK